MASVLDSNLGIIGMVLPVASPSGFTHADNACDVGVMHAQAHSDGGYAMINGLKTPYQALRLEGSQPDWYATYVFGKTFVEHRLLVAVFRWVAARTDL